MFNINNFWCVHFKLLFQRLTFFKDGLIQDSIDEIQKALIFQVVISISRPNPQKIN